MFVVIILLYLFFIYDTYLFVSCYVYITYVENHGDITGLQMVEKVPASVRVLSEWESENFPFKLPNDLKNFFFLSNGIMLRWYMNMKEELCPLGCMNINSISQVKSINMKGSRIVPRDGTDPESDDEPDDETVH